MADGSLKLTRCNATTTNQASALGLTSQGSLFGGAQANTQSSFSFNQPAANAQAPSLFGNKQG